MSSPVLAGTDIPSDFGLMMQMAQMLSTADAYVPSALEGKPGNVLALMMRARSLDIPFAVACDELYIPRRGSNTVAQRARLMGVLARRAGHRFEVLVSDRHHCILAFRRGDETTAHRVEFTLQDAHRMRLTDPDHNNKGGQWDKVPDQMLYWRCLTRAISRHAPEVMMGIGGDFLYEEAGADQGTAPLDSDEVISEQQEQDRALIAEVVKAAQETQHLDDGQEREQILLKLGMDYGQILNYADPGQEDRSMREMLLELMAAARERKERQSAGLEVPPPTPWPSEKPAPVKEADKGAQESAGGDGPARARKAVGGRTGARARAAQERAERSPAPASPQEEPPVKTTAAPRKTAAKKAAAKKTSSSRRTASPAPAQPAAAPEPAPGAEQAREEKEKTPQRQSAAVPADPDNTMPCGCPADLVLFQNTHLKECTQEVSGEQ